MVLEDKIIRRVDLKEHEDAPGSVVMIPKSTYSCSWNVLKKKDVEIVAGLFKKEFKGWVIFYFSCKCKEMK